MGRKRPSGGELGDEVEPLVAVPHRLTWRVVLLLIPLGAAILFLSFLLIGHRLFPARLEAAGLWPPTVGEFLIKYGQLRISC